MRKALKYISLSIVLLMPFVLWMLPTDFFDSGEIVTCPSVLLFNMECIGCGLTRAVMHFHHLDFSGAIFYNYGVLLIYPLLAFFWFQRFYGLLKDTGIVKNAKA